MLVPKVERLERKIKELNAIKGGYRSEVDDALRRLKDKKIAKEEFDRIRLRNEERMERLSEKIRDLRTQIHGIRED
jgi:predicted  nucleic acid-binding Zn-ribbon protein